MAAQNQKDWSRSTTLVFIGLIASLIAIFAFITGKSTLGDVLKYFSLNPVRHENKPIPKDTAPTYPSSPKTQPRQVTERQKPPAMSVEKSDRRQSVTTDLSEQPMIIQELFAISDFTTLESKLHEYRKKGTLAVGNKNDHVPPDGCYVFVVDDKQVWAILIFENNRFYALNSSEIYSNLSGRFSGKRAIWVKYSGR